MKRLFAVLLVAALVMGGAFADEPVTDLNVAEFSGWASVQWGVDLDAGKTGFKNEYGVYLKLNLLNNGSKSTSGDGVWGELAIKTDGDTFIGWENGDSKAYNGDSAFDSNTGMGENMGLKVFVDTAKLHFGPAYIGIKSGDTQTGELKMDAAIRSADNDQGKWLDNVGPGSYGQGIVAGFATDMFGIDVDFRSYGGGAEYQYTNAYSLAAEASVTPIDGLAIKGGVSYNLGDTVYGVKDGKETKEVVPVVLGYSASAGYKLGLSDSMYIRPQIGFTGYNSDDAQNDVVTTDMQMAAGVLFGWGDIGIDANAGVPYLDGDSAKKVSPGVGVVAYIPLVATKKVGNGDTQDVEFPYNVRIMPSFYTGDILGAFTAAAYADIALMNSSDKAAAMAFALGLKYDAAVGDITVTPSAGIRFANASYMDNNLVNVNGSIFDGVGVQKTDNTGLYDGNFLNLKAGVDVGGLISNTTLSVSYESCNLLNSIDYQGDAVPAKMGTLNFKAKISL